MCALPMLMASSSAAALQVILPHLPQYAQQIDRTCVCRSLLCSRSLVYLQMPLSCQDQCSLMQTRL